MVFSKTRLMTYIQCPEKFLLNYVLKIRPIKIAPALVEGQALHHLLESALVYGRYIKDALDFAAQYAWESYPYELCNYPSEQDYQQAQNNCLQEARQFLDLIGPMEAKHMELHLEMPLIEPVTEEEFPDLHIQGYIDLVENFQGEKRLIDLKTTTRKPGQNIAFLSLELTIYAYLMALSGFSKSKELEIPVAYLHLIRTKSPQIVWDISRRTLDDYRNLVDICLKVADSIKNGYFWTNPGIHCGWCDYHPICYQEIDKAIDTFGEKNLARYLMPDNFPQETKLTAICC